MKTIKYPNGHVGTYDETLCPGDLITSYYKGYYEFVQYVPRENEVPLIYHKLRYKSNGKKVNSNKIKTCDAAYCRMAKDNILETIQELERNIKTLTKILDENR